MSAVSKNKLVVAGVPEHFNLPWHLALEAGKFKTMGLDVEYRDFSGGTGAMTAALANGTVDIAVLLAEGAVADVVRRGETKLVKVYVQSPLVWGIHVAADSEIKSIEEIKDKRYAISRLGSGSHLMAIVDASERGWEAESLEFEIVRNLEGAREALSDDDADIFMWEQFTTQPFVDNGEFRRIGLRRTLWPAFVVAVRNDVLKARSSMVRKMLEVINDECAALMQNTNAYEMISKRYKLRSSQAREWLSLTRWGTNFERPDDALKKILSYLNRLEIINAPDASIEDVWQSI